MSEIITSLVVQFTAGSGSGVLQLEIDSRDDGHNAGSTSFTPGQVVYYLLTKTSDVNIVEHLSTAGAIKYVTSEVVEEEEVLTYAGASSASTAYPIHGAYTTKWLGVVPPADVVLTDPTTLSLRDTAGGAVEGLGVLRVNYSHVVDVYKLYGLPATLNGEDSYSVIIYVVGEN